jgi:hypothetical protein
MDKKELSIWIIFIGSFIIGIFGFLAVFEIYNFLSNILYQREIWHIICFFSAGIFLFCFDLLILRKNKKKFVILLTIFYLLLIFLSIEWEFSLGVLSFLDLTYTNSFSHFWYDLLGLFLGTIFNFLIYRKITNNQ